MTDTAQPGTPPAGSENASTADQLAAAADAFKATLGQEGVARDDRGRFAARADEEESLGPGLRRGTLGPRSGTDEDDPVPDEAEAAADGAEEDADPGDDEAADEAQPDDVAMPASWTREDAALWSSLPPEAQARIAEREGQRDRAISLKFQEAANLRKAHEAEIIEAQSNRQRYAEAVDQVLSLVVPQMPPRSMLDVNSDDYDPDAYHYRKALFEDTAAFLNGHAHQRRAIAAQEELARFNALNEVTRDAFIASVPDATDQAKAPALFGELIEYAVSLGTPVETFDAPTTAIEWHVLWKAREYDRLQRAKARVDKDPKPEPRKAQPAVRPGAATPRSAVEQAVRGKAMDRLRREGSVEAGAAAFKHLLKGKLS